MNKIHDTRGKFSSKKAKIKIWGIIIIVIAATLALAIVGAQEVYSEASTRISQKIKDVFSPKVIEVKADTPEPTDMKEWVLWRVKNAGIDPYEAYSIVNCESRWNDQATHVNQDKENSVDMGIWMINTTKWQKHVSPECAYNYKCATEEAIKIYQKRGNWSAWACAKIVGLK